MKNLKSIIFYCMLSSMMVLSISSCKKNDEGHGAPTVTRIRKVFSSVNNSPVVTAQDSTTSDGKIGTLYAIIGNNLLHTTAIYLNGTQIYFNIAYASNTTLQFSVPNTVPYSSSSTSNVITVVNPYGKVNFPFVIEQPLPSIYSLNQFAGVAGDVLTISGATFNGLSGVTIGTTPATIIKSTPTVITVTVPAGITYGPVSVTTVATKGGGVGTGPLLTSGTSLLSNNVSATHQSSAIFGFSTAIFDDAVENSWNVQGGWDGTPYTIDTKTVRRGTSSINYTFSGGYNGFIINAGNGNAVDANTAIKFSIFGGKNTNGKNIHLVLNYAFNTAVQITLVEGQWTDYQIPVANFADAANPVPAKINNLVFQEFSGNASQFNMDDVGLVELK